MTLKNGRPNITQFVGLKTFDYSSGQASSTKTPHPCFRLPLMGKNVNKNKKTANDGKNEK